MFDKIDISPADIRHKEFKTNALGYNKIEVREYLEMLSEHFEEIYTQRLMNDNAQTPVNIYEDNLQTQIALEQIQKREELISKTLIHAENTKNEIIYNAKKEADTIKREAELTAKKIMDETRHYINIMKQEFLNLKENHKQFLLASHSRLKAQLTKLEQDELFSNDTEKIIEDKINSNFINSNIKPEPISSNDYIKIKIDTKKE